MAEEVAALSVRLEANIARFERNMQRAKRTMDRRARSMENRASRLDRRLERVGDRFGINLNPRIIAGTAALAAFGKAVTDIVRSGDRLRQLEGRFVALTGSAERSARLINAAFAVGSETGAPFDAIASGLTRFTIAAEAIGATDDEVVQLTQNIIKLGTIGGGTIQEIRSGTIQFGQALAKGRLDGDELRSVMENLPLVAKELADGLGIGVGQLKAMGEAGELTSRRVFDAMLAKTDEVNRQFAELPVTVERAANQMANSWTRFTAALNESIGASEILATILQSAADLTEIGAIKVENLVDVDQQIADRIREIQDELLDLAGQLDELSPLALTFDADEPIKAKIKALNEELFKLEIAATNAGAALEAMGAPNVGRVGAIVRPIPAAPQPPPRRPFGLGVIDLRNEQPFSSARGGGRSAPTIDEETAVRLLETLRERIELLRLEMETIGATNIEAEALNAAFDKRRALEELEKLAADEKISVTQEQIDQAKAQIDTIERLTLANARLQQAEEDRIDRERRQAEAIDDVARSLENAILHADNFSDVLKNLAAVLSRALSGALTGGGSKSGLGSLFSAIVPGIGSLFGGGGGAPLSSPIPLPRPFAAGGIVDRGQITPFASGGIVSRPTLFPMKNGTGLMGEAGPEAILPLKRGPGGRLGVEASGGGSNTIVNIDASGADPAALARVEATLREVFGPGVFRRRVRDEVMDLNLRGELRGLRFS